MLLRGSAMESVDRKEVAGFSGGNPLLSKKEGTRYGKED